MNKINSRTFGEESVEIKESFARSKYSGLLNSIGIGV